MTFGTGSRLTFGTQLVTRAQWGARDWRCLSFNITPEGVTVHYGGPSPWGNAVDRSSPEAFRDTADHNRCASILRAYQAYHLDTQGWCDLAYSSAVCPHGSRYEGRGYGVRTGAQGTNDGNQRSYAVVYLAGTGDPLTDEAKRAYLDEAIRFNQPLRWGHRDWKQTSCPGDPIYAWRQAGFPAPGGSAPPSPPLPSLPPTDPGVTVSVMLPVLRTGHRGGAVRSLQSLLNSKAGQGLAVDGAFGPATLRAVRNVQLFFRLSPDGIVGQHTWGVLFL